MQQQKDPTDSVTERARQKDGVKWRKTAQATVRQGRSKRGMEGMTEQERLGGQDGARKAMRFAFFIPEKPE